MITWKLMVRTGRPGKVQRRRQQPWPRRPELKENDDCGELRLPGDDSFDDGEADVEAELPAEAIGAGRRLAAAVLVELHGNGARVCVRRGERGESTGGEVEHRGEELVHEDLIHHGELGGAGWGRGGRREDRPRGSSVATDHGGRR